MLCVFLFLSADRGCAGTAVVWERRPRHQPAGPCPNIHAMFSNTISFFSDQSYWELRDITFGIPVSKWISASDKGNWKWQHVWAVAQLEIKRRKLQGFFCGGTMYNNCTIIVHYTSNVLTQIVSWDSSMFISICLDFEKTLTNSKEYKDLDKNDCK